ncbi:GNAT family N-acetyltransferase [Kribbella sp. NPDC051952]|uniref:GNAT family N-acetyltransferase n=1 Tax=Kribbella sp. NPDC051952 TaxID=3154851 RepID=UPI0034476F14
MISYDLVLTDQPTDADTAAVSDGLDEFNLAAAGVQDRQPLAVLVKDPDSGRTLGGLTGRTSLGLWFVDLLYLPDSLRGSGLGGRMLQQAETEARRRGCVSGFVYTISFQAPKFYKHHGWTEFGRIPTESLGISRIFLTKTLD